MAAAATAAALALNSAFTPKLVRPFNYSPSSYSSSLRSFCGLQLRSAVRQATGIAVARQGGRHYRRPSGGRRRPSDRSFNDPNYDPALDLDRIGSNSVRLLDQEQNMVGVVSLDEAIQMADDSELLLAILSPDADPPVLRLFDIEEYKKHKYEQLKKKKVQQKRSLANRVDIKEVKMGYNIDSHDYSVRLRAAKRFLNDGDKVKVIVNLKRRENEFKNNAIELLKRFQADIGELATVESRNFNVRDIFLVLMPNKAVIQKNQEQPKKKEEQSKQQPSKEPAKESAVEEVSAGV